MPALSPRVQVSLSPSLDSLVERMAALQRISKSQVIRDLLQAAEPALVRAVALMQAAEGAPQQLLDQLGGSLLRAQERIEDQAAAALARLDNVTSDLVSQAEEVRGRRPPSRRHPARSGEGAAAAPPSNPPPSNRGVKSIRTPTRNLTKGRRK